jgi:hypothetical protein
MQRLFQILAVILAGIAAYFFWQDDTSKSFVAGVLAAVSFFLSVRFQVSERMRQREAEEEETWNEEDEFEEENPETPQLNEIPANEQINNGQLTTDNEPKI